MGKRLLLAVALVMLFAQLGFAEEGKGVFSKAVKVDGNTISIEKVVPEIRQSVVIERGALEKKLERLKEQKAAMIEKKNKEIAEVEKYLAECDKLGIVAKPAGDKDLPTKKSMETGRNN